MLPHPPVTEFADLRLKPGFTLGDSVLQDGLRRVNAEQSAWSTFPLHWFTYTPTDDSHETHVCILSQWASVSAHQAWIDSPQNQDLLALLGPKLDIASFCHIDLHVSRQGVELDEVLEASNLSWETLGAAERAFAGDNVELGDACGWAVDSPEPKFFVFRIEEPKSSGNTSSRQGSTIMSRLNILDSL
ncbi:hypothetical protein BDV93DRAFT_214882 [Ceratobasidium sp. AG-I]|nr:hypothetical protein BDV93DRAFT_214882 [Ceratobasidium sp. AG-I]